ncbi:hypothetical protein [Kiloniella sp.]|uniref:hypothetical protein n=1 Tax=Kiloniella sp. TaxID=1938587 RepID=UPI003B015FDD
MALESALNNPDLPFSGHPNVSMQEDSGRKSAKEGLEMSNVNIRRAVDNIRSGTTIYTALIGV